MLSRSPARKFLAYARPYRWWIAAATACGLAKYNLPVLFPWILKDVIDRLLDPANVDVRALHLSMATLVGVYLVWAGITYLRSWLADTASQRMVFDLRRDLFEHVQRMSLSFHDRRQAGATSSRLLGDVAVAQNFVGAAFTNTLMDASSLLVIAALLFSMNVRLAVICLSIFPVYLWLNRTFKKRIRATSREAQQQMERISGDLHERLRGVAVTKGFGRERTEALRFFRQTRTHLALVLANVRNHAAALALVGFVTSVAPVVVVWYGAMQVLSGRLTVGGLAAFYAYLGMFYQPLNRLTELNLLLANSRSAMERIFEVLETSPEVVDQPGAPAVGRVRGEVRFEGVWFGYDAARPVLQGVDLHATPGRTIALVGPSGSGKSTFVKLLPRFYDVSRGRVSIDGKDVRDLSLGDLRRQIAIVPQDGVLFSGTIEENIRYGRLDATAGEVRAAALQSDAHGFIEALPEGYATRVGEGGATLSGGERQRIALARAFLKDAPILVLDEATSSLDSASENSIQQALSRLRLGRTAFVIAHRLATVLSADRIAVFREGRIVESGRHAELLDRPGGLYRRLYEEQFGRIHLPAAG
ncbi:MAG: ABC transporter ATP-binding protein [Planctomycetes bacterium]|nr:ABC transporter ATP-binding protein [Planctomycetota bacterium]